MLGDRPFLNILLRCAGLPCLRGFPLPTYGSYHHGSIVVPTLAAEALEHNHCPFFQALLRPRSGDVQVPTVNLL